MSPGLVVLGEDAWLRGCSFKSQHRIVDGHFFTLICLQNCVAYLKRPKKWKKSSGMILLANICCISEISKNWKTPANWKTVELNRYAPEKNIFLLLLVFIHAWVWLIQHHSFKIYHSSQKNILAGRFRIDSGLMTISE